ncbi:hypothetical protein LCGC14_1545130 [marine sediment metagenome]|uniref:Uncharacterized protein n=1 Tax=marine sediment metagenome TaxID=412755 RepID=A0A0F9IRT5_9ZZZZ
MHRIEYLKQRQGQTVESVQKEIYCSDGSLISILLKFPDGNPLVLTCAGSGGIVSRRAGNWHEDPETRLEDLKQVGSGQLLAIDEHESSLTIVLSGWSLTISNDCDELEYRLKSTQQADAPDA